ncbi:hypothetical protein BDV11DRAFT_187560 [Aspergillus similis]
MLGPILSKFCRVHRLALHIQRSMLHGWNLHSFFILNLLFLSIWAGCAMIVMDDFIRYILR